LGASALTLKIQNQLTTAAAKQPAMSIAAPEQRCTAGDDPGEPPATASGVAWYVCQFKWTHARSGAAGR